MKTPDLPEEKPSVRDKRDYTGSADFLADEIRARLQVGEIVGALDFPETDRWMFWGAIAKLRDEMPGIRSGWRTTDEMHVDGLRTRQRVFKICSRQHGGHEHAHCRTECLGRSIRHRADGAAGVGPADGWRTAQRAALEIPSCRTANARHKAISDLLAQLSSLLGSAGRK